MLRRRKLDSEKARAQVEQARRAAELARRAEAKVDASEDEIMREVRAHERLLRINNFAAKLHAALGGEGA